MTFAKSLNIQSFGTNVCTSVRSKRSFTVTATTSNIVVFFLIKKCTYLKSPEFLANCFRDLLEIAFTLLNFCFPLKKKKKFKN